MKNNNIKSDNICLIIFGIGVIAFSITGFLAMGDSRYIDWIIFLVFFMFMGFLSIMVAINNMKKEVNVRKMVDNNNYIIAMIDYSKCINSTIFCYWINPNDNRKYEFETIFTCYGNCVLDILKELEIDSIKVYVESDDMNKYVVDTSSIESRIVDLT